MDHTQNTASQDVCQDIFVFPILHCFCVKEFIPVLSNFIKVLLTFFCTKNIANKGEKNND